MGYGTPPPYQDWCLTTAHRLLLQSHRPSNTPIWLRDLDHHPQDVTSTQRISPPHRTKNFRTDAGTTGRRFLVLPTARESIGNRRTLHHCRVYPTEAKHTRIVRDRAPSTATLPTVRPGAIHTVPDVSMVVPAKTYNGRGPPNNNNRDTATFVPLCGAQTTRFSSE
jgi:hypothetical protein